MFHRILPIIVCVVLLLIAQSAGAQVRGVYKVPVLEDTHPSSYVEQLEQAGVNAVFGPDDPETIAWFKEQGFLTYVSIPAMRECEAFKDLWGSRVVDGQGRLLAKHRQGTTKGWLCPSHSGWREKRLGDIEKLLQAEEAERVDGIWLDYIRYPGHWSKTKPSIPNTCFCSRCIEAFSRAQEVDIPEDLQESSLSQWIVDHHLSAWMTWKKETITSFVRQVKELIAAKGLTEQITLGAFVVPWRKGERGNALVAHLGQDPFAIAQEVDVLSPMLYHEKVGREVDWVGAMTAYYTETAKSAVWPIVQTMEVNGQEMDKAVDLAGQAGAEGILAFHFNYMQDEHFKALSSFEPRKNLIENPEFAREDNSTLPHGWETDQVQTENVLATEFKVRPSRELDGQLGLGITGGRDHSKGWSCQIPECEPGQEYEFEALFYRPWWKNGAYPAVSIWGEEYYLNNHWLRQEFQPIRVDVRCPDDGGPNEFRFVNHNPKTTIYMAQPRLHAKFSPVQEKNEVTTDFFGSDFFPIGVYGARLEDLEEIAGLGINSVFLTSTGDRLIQEIKACHELGLRYVIKSPRDPDLIPEFCRQLEDVVQSDSLAFYVDDEPSIHSTPQNRSQDVNQLIKAWFPDAATCMAIIRPWVCADYAQSTDFFMLDQYPVPFMPMTWLSDSMDEAAEQVGRKRLGSVIQAFGGQSRPDHPRPPTWREMDCLAFLSLVHDSQGVFFFTYSQVGKTAQGRDKSAKVAGRLGQLGFWLTEPNNRVDLPVEMTSAYGLDEKGRPAVHTAVKEKGKRRMLIVVNSIATHVQARIKELDKGLENADFECQEVFGQEYYLVQDGVLEVKLGPHESKVFVY